jgi:hypothetical protein
MDKKFLEKKGLLKEAKRFNYIMEYVSNAYGLDEVDGNGDGLDDASGMADPMAGGAAAGAPQDPMAGGGMPGADPMGGGAMPGAPAAGGATPAAPGAPGADPNAAQGVPGFDPQPAQDTDPSATAEGSFDEATPDAASGGEEEEVIDVDQLVDGQKRNEDAIDKLTDKFERFLEKFSEFQGELKSNADYMANLESEFQKRNPTSVEKLTMRSLQSKPFQETPEEYMANDAPENYSPESDNNGVGEPRYTSTRDDVRNATDYSSIAKTLRDNGNATLKNLLGF